MLNPSQNRPRRTPPPSRHQLALMIWLCVFPTLTVLNVTFGDWLASMSPVVRTFILATIAVPIVIYVLMPHLHRAASTCCRAQTPAPAEVEHGFKAGGKLRAEPPAFPVSGL